MFCVLLYWIFRRQFISLIDNMFIMLCFQFGIYFATVFFMFDHKMIEYVSLSHFILSMIGYIFGFFIFGKLKRPCIKNIVWGSISRQMYNISVCIYFVTSIYMFAVYGSPLLAGESRIGFYKNIGIIKIINDLFQLVSIFFIVEKITVKNTVSLRQIIEALVVFIALLLSGSKSAFFQLFVAVNIYLYYFTDRKILSNKYIILLSSIFVIIIAFRLNGNYDYLLLEVINAIAGRGDVYVNFYGAGYDNILSYYNSMGIDNFVLNVCNSTLTRFGLLNYDDSLVKYTWSDKMSIYISGSTFDGGVNNVFNVFSLTYVGFWGSVIATFIVGMISGWIRNKLIYVVDVSNVYVRLIFFIVLINLPSLFIMIHGFVSFVVTSIIILTMVYVFLFMVSNYLTVTGERDV